VSELVEAATTGSQSGQPGALRPEDVLERARTVRSSRNLRVAVSKTGSRSPWLKYTLDGVRATFSASSQSGASPQQRLSATDSWSGNVSYRLTPPKPVTVRPFWFTGGLPVLGGLRINVLPQNLALSADAGRRTTANQDRLGSEFLFGPDGLPEADSVRDFRALTRRTHSFDHGRQLDLRYVPLPFLQFGYASTTDQDFGAAGQLETARVLVRDTLGAGFARTYTLTPAEARNDLGVIEDLAAAGLQDPDGGFPDGVEVLGGPRLEVLPLGEALQNVFAGGGRTRAYGQRLTSSLRISTGRLKWLRWIQPQPISYSADYNWRDQPVPSADTLEVASAGASAQIQSSLRVVPREFWRLFPFYRALEEARDAPADSARGFSPFRLARGLFLGLTGVEDVTVGYRGSLTSSTGGLRGQEYNLLSGLQGSAPPLAYRLGLERRLGVDRRLASRDAYSTFNDLLGERHDFDARTSFRPLAGLTVGLTWRAGWQEAETTPFSVTEENTLVEQFSTRRGDGSSTVWSFGGSYDAVVRRHADRYRADVAEPGPDGVVESEFLSPTGLADDFSAVLARGLGSFGPGGFVRVPLPNWQVTYSGLERLPLVRALADQVTLQHGYSSEMQTGYQTNTREAADPTDPLGAGLSLVGAADLAGQAFDEPNSVNVTERFQPLVGLTVGWKGGLQTTVTYNRSALLQLQPTQTQVTEKGTEDVRVDVSWTKQGLRLLGLRRLNNNFRFTLTGVVSDEASTTRPFRDDVIAFLTPDVEAPVPAVRSQQRLQLSPRISYTISNQVTADVFVRYERLLTEGTSAFPSRSFDGGVNLRILFSN
jgi:cell surface protein SprA